MLAKGNSDERKKHIYLLLDEWDNDRNFVGKELELISDRYDVTVICNSASVMLNDKVRYSIYKRPGKILAAVSILRMLVDGDVWNEIGRVLKEDSNKAAKLSEVIRFYINADLFRSYMKKQGYLECNALYYSYWYFWKCYAVTHEINKYPGSRVITRTHEYDLYDYTSPSGYQPFKESMDAKLDRVIFISEHGMDYYLRKYNRKAGEKYKLYRLGTKDPFPKMDRKHFPYETMTETKEREDVNEGEISLVSCSSIIARKRVQRIVEALSLIENVKISWKHFGTGDQADELAILAEEKLGQKTNIKYELMGYVTNEELHEYYMKHYVNVFITTSSSEGNPVSVMEAMSYGIPVIAPAVCNFPNMIKGSGILIDEKCEPEDLADAIRRFVQMSGTEVITYRRNARRCWEEKFDADKNNRRFVDEILC